MDDFNPPGFHPFKMEHKEIIAGYLAADPPVVSELTFTNLFMWRHHYRPYWLEVAGCLTIMSCTDQAGPFGFAPIGLGNKAEALERLVEELGRLTSNPMVCRAPGPFVEDWVDPDRFRVSPDPDNYDYVYRTEDLIHLPGRNYHKKKNHLNHFEKEHAFECKIIDAPLVRGVLDLQDDWCQLKDCESDPGLSSENRAIYEAMRNYDRLDCRGLVILIDDKIEAFTFGEALNPTTAVVHAEKANPDIRGLYAAINQRFCQNVLHPFEFVNREQDLGAENLRKAKQSYHPHHLEEKYIVTPV